MRGWVLLALAGLTGAQRGFGASKRVCDPGMTAATIQTRANNIIVSCAAFEDAACVSGCGWAYSCKRSTAWNVHGGPEKTYLRGFRHTKDGQWELEMCEVSSEDATCGGRVAVERKIQRTEPGRSRRRPGHRSKPPPTLAERQAKLGAVEEVFKRTATDFDPRIQGNPYELSQDEFLQFFKTAYADDLNPATSDAKLRDLHVHYNFGPDGRLSWQEFLG